jgi:hypothetical protein
MASARAWGAFFVAVAFELSLSSSTAAQSAAPAALLKQVRNVVRVGNADGHREDSLARGDKVATQKDALADLQFKDGTNLRLNDESTAILFDPNWIGAARRASAQATLVRGSLRASREALEGGTLRVFTDAGNASMTQGEAQVSIDANRKTRLAVYRGSARLGTATTSVVVPEGFGSELRIGRAPTPLVRLPAAPIWQKSIPSVVLSTSEASAMFASGLGTTKEPARWHLQVASDPKFENILSDTHPSTDQRELAATPRKAGTYYARVSAVDDDEFEGPFSKTESWTIATMDVQVLPLHRTMVSVVPSSLYCALDDSAPKEMQTPLLVDRVHRHSVRCGSKPTDMSLASVDLPSEPLGRISVDVRWLSQDAPSRKGEVAVFVTEGLGDAVARDDVTVSATTPGIAVTQLGAGHEYGSYRTQIRWEPNATTFTLAVRVAGLGEATSRTMLLPTTIPPRR